MTATEAISHVSRDAAGVLRVRGTGYKVIMLLGEHVHQGWDAEEMHRQHPDLTLGQIYSVLGHYYDHLEELRAELAEREQHAAELLGEFDRDGKLRTVG